MCGRMAGCGSERSAVLVVRVWTEDDEAEELRARITHVVELSERETSEIVAGSRREILAAVESWLDAFVSQARR